MARPEAPGSVPCNHTGRHGPFFYSPPCVLAEGFVFGNGAGAAAKEPQVAHGMGAERAGGSSTTAQGSSSTGRDAAGARWAPGINSGSVAWSIRRKVTNGPQSSGSHAANRSKGILSPRGIHYQQWNLHVLIPTDEEGQQCPHGAGWARRRPTPFCPFAGMTQQGQAAAHSQQHVFN